MHADMACEPTIRNDIRARPDGTIGINLMHAISLIVVLALLALQTRVDLGADADALALLDQRHFGPDPHRFPDDFVAAAEGEVLGAPAAGDGVHVGAADAAGFDLHVDIVVFEWLGFELEKGC